MVKRTAILSLENYLNSKSGWEASAPSYMEEYNSDCAQETVVARAKQLYLYERLC